MTEAAVSMLEHDFDVHSIFAYADTGGVPPDLAEKVRGIAGGKVKGALIEALPKLEIIANSGVGVDSNDIPTARSRGVIVTNTPDVLNESVSELTVGLMLALARNLPRADGYVRTGEWKEGPFGLGTELRRKTVGIVGLGRIGKEIASRLDAFRMQIGYHGRQEQPDQPYRYFADLVEMAAQSDWLVVIAPANDTTKGIISRPVLEALGPQGRFVNVARGSLVDQPALVDLLQSGGLGGAALDVFENEPDVQQELQALENVVLSPHQGSRTEEAREAMDALVVDNLKAHFNGQTAPNRVV